MNQIALVGKPNSGKSSLFNLLTGLNQKIGNYSGVTVEKKEGRYKGKTLYDLPGLKSIRAITLEEKISRDILLKYSAEQTPVIFVANGLQLEDNLILFSEVADLQIPSCLVINFKDDLLKNNIDIDVDRLSDHLGCPVILMNSRTGDGLKQLEEILETNAFSVPNAFCRSHYEKVDNGIVNNKYIEGFINAENLDLDLLQRDYFNRQRIVNSYVRSDVLYRKQKESFLDSSKKLDRVLLHPFFGSFIFLTVMLSVFQSVFFLATFPMDWIDLSFVWLAEQSGDWITIPWMASLISEGIIPGVAGVLIFIPQIAILFFLLGVLEHSGYLSRISFIANRFLSKFGLTGQSVVPLMSSWACAIPAIMSARIINDPKERFALIFAAPLMTCSARLPVYTILIAIMVPSSAGTGFFNIQGLLLLLLYLLGIVSTLLVAKVVNKGSRLIGNPLFTIELPIYRIPNWRNVFYNMYLKTKAFVVEAGKVIFIVSMVLWVLASFSPRSASYIQSQYESRTENAREELSIESVQLEYSYAGYIGKVIEPVIRPLGYDWKIGIALISSFAAREVFVGAIATIYSIGSEEDLLIKQRLRNETNPRTGEPRFNLATCVSLLMFYVFALQCMSTMAVVKKELGQWKYPLIQFVVMFILAYSSAFIAYQILS